jgi:hypothetical protein
MGILKSKSPEKEAPAKRRSQPDFASLGPLKPGGAVGFLNYREGEDSAAGTRRKSKKGSESDMDSDEDGEAPVIEKAENEETTDATTHLSPDDIRRQGDLAEGVRKIKV